MAFLGPDGLPIPLPPPAHSPQVIVTLHPGGQVETRTNLASPGAWPVVVNLLLQALLSARQEEEKERQASAPRVQLAGPGTWGG